MAETLGVVCPLRGHTTRPIWDCCIIFCLLKQGIHFNVNDHYAPLLPFSAINRCGVANNWLERLFNHSILSI